MVDLSKINTIKEAQEAEYNGVKLTRQEEKNIFDDSRLKDSSDASKPNVSELRNTAKLLDEVKKARAKTVWNEKTDQAILDKIKKAKNDDDLAAKVINTVTNEGGIRLIDDVITHLEGLKASYKPKDTGDKIGGRTLAEWTTMRDGFKAQVDEVEARIKEIEKEKKDFVNLVATEDNDYRKAKKYRENVEKVLDAVKNDALGKQILENIVQRNKDYLSTYDGTSFVETNLGYEGKNYLFAEQLHDIGLKTWEQIKLMDETKLFSIINSDNYFTAANRTAAKAAYDRLKNRKWGYLTNSLYSMPGTEMTRSNMWSDKNFTAEEFQKENTLVFYDPNSYVNKPFDKRKEKEIKWPFEKPELNDIAIFMKSIFPRDKLNTNPIINSNDDELRGKEIVEISWFGFRNKPKDDEYIQSSTYHKLPGEKGNVKIRAQIGNSAGFFKVFWDAFKDDTWLDSEAVEVKTFVPTTSTTALGTENINRTKLETTKKVRNNLYTDNWREVLTYADRIKWVVENYKDSAGNALNIKFDDEWRKAAIEVGDTADITLGKLAGKKSKSMNKELTEEESKIGFALSFFENWGDDYDEDSYYLDHYDKFLSKAKAKEKEAKLASKSDKTIFAEIQNRLRRAQAEQLEAKRKQDQAQNWIDKFSGMDLDGLKKAFREIYKTGPSAANKYLPEEIGTMYSLLIDIAKKENNKKLDSTFNGYKNALDSLMNNLSKFVVITQPWVGLGGTIEEKIAKRSDLANETTKTRELKKLRDAFDGIKNLRKLGALEEEDYKSIKEVLDGIRKIPNKEPEGPKVILSQSDLQEAFGGIDGVATQALADKWGNEGISKTTIQETIRKACDDSEKKTPKGEFISHLKNGLDDGTKLAKTDADEIWKEFLSKDPERVVKTINTHWLETSDNEEATKKIMKEESKGTAGGDDEEKLDMSQYGASSKDGDPDKSGMVKYLWEKAKGGSGLTYYKVKGESNNGDGDKGEKTGVWNHLKSNWYWYTLGTVTVAALLVVVFWKSISEWWNGPAEEEGAGAEEKGEGEIEEDK